MLTERKRRNDQEYKQNRFDDSAIKGRPIFVYYSYNNESDRIWPAITDIRWGRIGHVIR